MGARRLGRPLPYRLPGLRRNGRSAAWVGPASDPTFQTSRGPKMLLKTSTLTGCAIQATGGESAPASDFLFDDITWSIRWLAVDPGALLSGRAVLLPASRLGEARS